MKSKSGCPIMLDHLQFTLKAIEHTYFILFKILK